MKLANLYERQSILDQKVTERVEGGYDVDSSYCVEDKIYAFHTEVHELANEVGFFKFWKRAHKQDPKRILDELVDCIHFLLSIGLSKGYSRIVKEADPIPLWMEYSFYDMFAMLRENNLSNIAHFARAFDLVMGIAYKLGFDDKMIEDAYYHKNETNMKRQNEGY